MNRKDMKVGDVEETVIWEGIDCYRAPDVDEYKVKRLRYTRVVTCVEVNDGWPSLVVAHRSEYMNQQQEWVEYQEMEIHADCWVRLPGRFFWDLKKQIKAMEIEEREVLVRLRDQLNEVLDA